MGELSEKFNPLAHFFDMLSHFPVILLNFLVSSHNKFANRRDFQVVIKFR
jgi:hypothetical protein